MINNTDIQSGPITYQWQVSADDGMTFTNISDAPNSPNLVLSNIADTQDLYQYRVVASSGGLSIVSNAAKLFVYPDINITSQPINQTTTDNTVDFSCGVVCSSGSSVSYQWQYAAYNNPNIFYPIVGATGTSLSLNNVTEDDDGNYYRLKIIAKFSDTFPKTKYSNIAQLDYNTIPINILQQPQDLFLSDPSSPALFTVSAVATSGNSDLTYQWQESPDGINIINLINSNNPTLYSSSVDNILDKNQHKYRVFISSDTHSIYSNWATLHTGIELPLIDNVYNNTYLWGDPHLRIQSIKGPIANVDDNSKKDPIVYFYVKYPNGDSYKVVYANRFSSPSSTAGPAAISDIYMVYNGQTFTGASSVYNQSTATPSTDLILNHCTFAGVTGWDYLLGRCLSFSTTAGIQNLDNNNYVQLIKNSIKWLCKNKSNPSILLTSSGNSIQDNKFKNALTSLTNKTINIVSLSTFTDANNVLSTTDVLILQNNYNWSYETLPDAGQNAIKSFVTKGGGLLTTEWVLWNMAIGKFKILTDIVPVIPTASYTTKSPIRYIKNINESTLNNGVNDDFTFYSTNIAGTETAITQAKPGSIIFYHSEQCINTTSSTEKLISVGDIMSIIYKSMGNWGSSPYYNVYTRWNKTIKYDGELVIGGALYWILKSLIEHKKDPTNPKYLIWKGSITGATKDGYGAVMKPYNITRKMLEDAVNAADDSATMNSITEKITISNNFWKNLSKLLRGLQPNDKYYIKNIVYLTKNPGNRITTVNVPVSMDAQAFSTSGNTISYRWQVSANKGVSFSNLTNGSLYSGVTTNTLSILKPSLTDDGKIYRLSIASSGASTKYSNIATLNVLPSIIVSKYPTAQTASKGSATFSVEATSTSGTLKYQWQKASSKNGTYSNISGATSNTLVVSVTSYSQHNSYYRVVLNNTTSSTTTNGVQLIANPIITITAQPSKYTTNNGQAVFSALCTVSSPLITIPTLTYQWQVSSNDRYYTNLVNENKPTLSLTNVTASKNKYYYRLVIKTTNATAITTPAQLIVLPSISYDTINSIVTYDKINNIDYATITLSVKASSTSGSVTYQWQQSKDGGFTYANITNTNVNQIVVKNIPKNLYQYYRYRVLISNSIESVIVY